jgi:hypothetical protein
MLIHHQVSIAAIKNSICFKVTIGLMVKSLRGFLPLWKLSYEGHLYLCSDWVQWLAKVVTPLGIFPILLPYNLEIKCIFGGGCII